MISQFMNINNTAENFRQCRYAERSASPSAAGDRYSEGAACAAVGKKHACFIRRCFCRTPQTELVAAFPEYAERDSLPLCQRQSVRMHRRPAGDAQQPTGLLDLDGSCPSSYVQKRGRPLGRPLFWYTGRDSNPQPSEPESDALSIEPPVHLLFS